MGVRTHHGSCHCGEVRFTCTVDWAVGTSRCNCSSCAKTRFWKVIVPASAFQLLSREASLSEYRFGRGSIAHHFCRRCGVKPFGRGESEAVGGPFYAVNVACLDDISAEELAELPVRYEDGRADRWEVTPAETRHL